MLEGAAAVIRHWFLRKLGSTGGDLLSIVEAVTAH